MVLGNGEQVRPCCLDPALGKGASGGQHAPRFETTGNLEVVSRVFRTTIDQRRLKRGDYFFFFSLPRANCGNLLHPLRIAIGELIDTFVIGGGIVEAHQALFESGTRCIKVGPIGADGNRLGINIDRRRVVLKAGLDAGQHR